MITSFTALHRYLSILMRNIRILSLNLAKKKKHMALAILRGCLCGPKLTQQELREL